MTTYEWSPPHPGVAYLALGLALAALLLLVRRAARAPAARSGWLLLLRAGVLALLVAILLNPTRVTEVHLPPRPPEVVYLVDCSRSMALDRPISRLARAREVLWQSEHPRPSGSPRVSLFRFGDRLSAVSDASELQPTEDASRLREALERLPGHFADGPPVGVVLFSDGQASESTGFAEVANGYRRLGVPLHVVPLGDPVAGDVAIQDVIAPREAPAGARLPVRIVLRSRGYAGQRAEVRIQALSGPAARPLATLPVTLADGRQTHELLLDYNPGLGRLLAEVSTLPGEAILENNRVPFQIGARKPKVRVIYMEGTVGNEYHWVRDALAEDPNIECLVMEVNNQYIVRPTLHRVNDPGRGYPTTREELFSYDVVICSDINRATFTQEQLDWTVELVHKRGGGFAMVGGITSFGAGFWDRTAWDALIPVDMSGQWQGPERGTCPQTFAVKVPPQVERHPIWRIAEGPVQNRQILNRMPPFTGTNLIERLKPAATLLGETDRPLPGVGIMPVFSCQPFGKGRTFAMSTDTTIAWGTLFERDWGENGDNRYFRKFWRNVVLWLGENSGGSNRRLRLEADKVIYRTGEPIRISARAYDDKLEETSRYRLVAQLRAGGSGGQAPALLQETTLAPRSRDRIYEGELRTPPLQQAPIAVENPLAPLRLLTLEVAAHDKDGVAARASMDIQVLDDPAELEDPQPNTARLEEMARISGGQVLHSGADLRRILDGHATGPGEVVVQKTPLWDHVGLWLGLLALLTAEWVLRRWWGLA